MENTYGKKTEPLVIHSFYQIYFSLWWRIKSKITWQENLQKMQ